MPRSNQQRKMSSKKCIIRGCTGLRTVDNAACRCCASPNPQYAVQFYSSLWRGPRDYKLPCHTVTSNFPWTTCGTPATDSIDCATLEQDMIATTQRVERLHAHWWWAAQKTVTQMHWDTGTYVHDLTPDHLATLRQKRTAYFAASDETTDNMLRCVKDCVINCDCHPWYGIVLTPTGTKIDTALNPLPTVPYVRCVDCYHISDRNARSREWMNDPGYMNPFDKSTCKACVDRPRRRRIRLPFEGYPFHAN